LEKLTITVPQVDSAYASTSPTVVDLVSQLTNNAELIT